MDKPVSNRSSGNRLMGLDILRGLAALAVVLFHYTTKLQDFLPAVAPTTIRFASGFYGVQLFFMVSGFVILMSLSSRKGEGFIRSRLIRLYPLFWASVLLTTLVLLSTSILTFELTPGLLIANLSMLQGYFRMAAIDGVYWSLTYELGFYFLMYLIFRIGGAKYIEAIPLYMMAGAIAFYQFSQWIPHPLHYLFMVNPYAHLFGGGMAFFLIYQDRVTALRLLAILLVPLIQYLYSGVDGLIAGFLCIGLMAWGTSAIDPFGLKARQGQLVKAMVGLGAISYALYLTHQMIGYVAIGWLNQMGVSTDIAVGITLIGAIILAWVLTNGVEKPSAAYLKRILPKDIDLLATWTSRKTS